MTSKTVTDGGKKMPSNQQLDIAVMWLRSNDCTGQEQEACNLVADWIDHLTDEAFLRREARSAGIPVAQLRRQIAERSKSEPGQ